MNRKRLSVMISSATAVMLFAGMLTGCADVKPAVEEGDAASMVAEAAASSNYVLSDLDVGIPAADIMDIQYRPELDRVFAICGSWDDDSTDCTYTLYDFTPDGNDLNAVPLQLDQTNISLAGITVNSDGSMAAVASKLEGSNVSSDTAMESDSSLIEFSPEGEEKWKVSLNDRAAEDGSYYICGMTNDAEGDLVLSDISGITVFNVKDGTKKKDIYEAKDGELSDRSIFRLHDGNMVSTELDEESGTDDFFDMDIKNGSMKERSAFAFDPSDYTPYTGINHDLLLTTQDGVYGYDIDDQNLAKVIDYESMGLPDYALSGLTPISPTQIIAISLDMATGTNKLVDLLAPEAALTEDATIEEATE